MIQKIWKRILHLRARMTILLHEKKYSSGLHSLRYLYLPHSKSRLLVVIFSAFPGASSPAGYNMVSSFSKHKVNKLYILDNFGYQNRGSYYLGENGAFFIPPMVEHVIQKYRAGMEQVVFLGSSKGGYAAMYYGLSLSADLVVAGAPQYLLGNYLFDKQEHREILRAIAGDTGREQVEQLNRLLKDKMGASSARNATGKPRFLIHYSPLEPTFQAHIQYLLQDLKKAGYQVEEDVEAYTKHSDVALHFPALCRVEIKKLEGERKHD